MVTPGSGSPSRRRGRGCPCTACAGPPAETRSWPAPGRRAAGASLPSRTAPAFRDHAELAGHDELAVGRAQDPEPVRRQGQLRREAPAVLGEEQDRVRGRDDIQLAHVIPADQRDVDGADRPGQRVRGVAVPPRLRTVTGSPSAVTCQVATSSGVSDDAGRIDLDAWPVRVTGDAGFGVSGMRRPMRGTAARSRFAAPRAGRGPARRSPGVPRRRNVPGAGRRPGRGHGSVRRSSRSRQRSTRSRA